MNNMRDILINEYHKYPSMEIVDFVKLIYQHVCGGNHLLKSIDKAKEYLLNEYHSIDGNGSIPLYEDIGNNIIRISLARYKYEGLDIDVLFKVFVDSSSSYHLDTIKMEQAFDILKELVIEGLLSFGINELEEYLNEYRNNDYPLVSHSETYKNQYDPHYRIIDKKYLDILINS